MARKTLFWIPSVLAIGVCVYILGRDGVFMKYKIKKCVWELTTACTMNCKHCGSKAGNKRDNELKWDEAKKVAEQLVELGCEKVALIGGEVTLVPYWAELAHFFSVNSVVCDIITNGYRKSEKDYEQIAKSKVRAVAISIDGFRDVHNKIRGKDDAFEELEKFVDRLNEMHIKITAITTITKECIADLPEIYNWLKSKKVIAWQWQQVSPMGNAKDNLLNCLSKDDLREVIDIYEKLSGAEVLLSMADNIGYYYAYKNRLFQQFKGCAAGLCVIGIDSVGNVKGCESLYDDKYIEGNLREETLADIWNDDTRFSYNRNFSIELMSGNCKECDVKHICAGGCRSFNAFNGELYNHVNCIKNI